MKSLWISFGPSSISLNSVTKVTNIIANVIIANNPAMFNKKSPGFNTTTINTPTKPITLDNKINPNANTFLIVPISAPHIYYITK